MPRRIIIHGGFHKTGTTSLQATLRENRTALKQDVALRLRWHLKDIISGARGYSSDRDPLTLIKTQSRFAQVVNALPGMPRRSLIISCEELAGHMPGRGDLDSYSATPILFYAYVEILRAKFPEAELSLFLTTRASDDWLVSAYWEHVKSSSMTMDFDAFQSRYQQAADLEGMATEIASRVPVPVHVKALEACRDLKLGTADPLLDLCNISPETRARLKPVPPANQRLGDEVLNQMLEINRSQSDPAQRKIAKQALLNEAKQA